MGSSEIVFVRCDDPSLEMKVGEMPGANKEHISKAYKTAFDHNYKGIYFTFLAEVELKSKGNYHINIKDVVETKKGVCNLLDAINTLSP